MRTAVLASGFGSLLEALLAGGVSVELVLTDRPCRAQEIARGAAIPTVMVGRKSFGGDFDRAGYTDAVVRELRNADIDLVVMAGFMTVLAPPMFERFGGRVINSHPSLLPAFPGAHAVADALAAGATETGCTIHIATEIVDRGPVLAQEKVAVVPGDSVETVHERIKEVERVLLPRVVMEMQQRLGSERAR